MKQIIKDEGRCARHGRTSLSCRIRAPRAHRIGSQAMPGLPA